MWSSWCRRRCGRHKPPREGVGGCGRACGQGRARRSEGGRACLRESPGAWIPGHLSPQRHRHVQCAHLASGLRVKRSNRARAVANTLSSILRGAGATDTRRHFGSGCPESTSHAPTRGIARGACIAHHLRTRLALACGQRRASRSPRRERSAPAMPREPRARRHAMQLATPERGVALFGRKLSLASGRRRSRWRTRHRPAC